MGVHFTKSFLPVARKTLIYIIIRIVLLIYWKVNIFDVEAAFLNAKCKSKVFMTWLKAAAELRISKMVTMSKYCIML